MSLLETEKDEEFNPQPVVNCPYLGLLDDPNTCYAYPRDGNACHRVQPPQPIRLDYQLGVCLSAGFQNCPVYHSPQHGTFPRGLRASAQGRLSRLWMIAAAMLAAAMLAGALFLFGSGGFDSLLPADAVAGGGESLSAAPPTMPQAATSPFSERTPTIGPAMMTPFGPDDQYILHRVRTGETLAYLASTYDTSVEVVEAANMLVSNAVLWPGDILVIMPGVSDPTGLQRFRVVLVEETVRVEEFADENSVYANNLRWHNSLGPDEWIPAGRWLIVPIEAE